MKIFDCYFDRNPVVSVPDFCNDPEVIVIIPVLNDPDIFATLDSLQECNCEEGNVGVIVIVNHGENADCSVKQANYLLTEKLRRYVQSRIGRQTKICFEVMEAFDLPGKFAGVGLARKIAMDAAALFLYRHGKPGAPILSLDADTLVEKNYPDVILRFFREHAVAGVSIAYAHRLEECDGEVLAAMMKYELYLRYYQLALEYIGHPHAFHCIGSAFAVRAFDYVAQGGMNKRQAGEDFYFLQKLISTGRYALVETTRVYPSARFSARTPFGTGQSVRQIVENGGEYPVYRFSAFRDLKFFFNGIEGLYKAEEVAIKDYFTWQAPGIRLFLASIKGEELIAEANGNCASVAQFIRRFYDHFNVFRVLKYLNYVHEQLYEKVDVLKATEEIFRELGYPYSTSVRKNLDFLRKIP